MVKKILTLTLRVTSFGVTGSLRRGGRRHGKSHRIDLTAARAAEGAVDHRRRGSIRDCRTKIGLRLPRCISFPRRAAARELSALSL